MFVQEIKNFACKTTDVVRDRQIVQGDEVETFWALRDVSFDVGQGDVLGIIGRNGAGKSTLLKVLSRITEPTAGRVTLHGRTASLLEVGTGFHPELAGRENIYLNGAVLGMTQREISARFDSIVDFAEVEKFIDTPVKWYSSGMYVRLAFAVAAHVDARRAPGHRLRGLKSAFCKRGSVNVRFAPKATEVLHCRELTRGGHEQRSTATIGIDMFGARCQPNCTGHLAHRRCAASSSMKARSCRRSRFLATARKRISIRTVLGSCHVFRTRRAESWSSPSKAS
jgi:hypothetical protein